MIKGPNIEPGKFEQQFELKQLYDLIPSIVLEKEFNPDSAKFTYGGYEYPKLDLRNVPDNKKEELGQKLRFVRNSSEGKKIVLEGNDCEMIDLKSMTEIGMEESYREKVEKIEEASEGKMLEDQDEEVKKRLEELGYIS